MSTADSNCPHSENLHGNSDNHPILQHARRRLSHHCHFRGRNDGIEIEMVGDQLVLRGKLPSFYLKQLVQEALNDLAGVQAIENQIEVVNSYGLSSVRLDAAHSLS